MHHPRIIILGAGLAGLSAAMTLRHHRYDVTILEARERIGGRVYTVPVSEEPRLTIELGGEWIGRGHKRLLKLCEEFHLQLINHSLKMHLIRNRRHFPPGTWSFSKRWNSQILKMLEDIKHADAAALAQLDTIDLWHYLAKNHISQHDLEILDLIESTNYGESILRASSSDAPLWLKEYAVGDFTKSNDYYRIDGGNSRLVKKMSQRIGRERIYLRHQAVAVQHAGSEVIVSCANGTTWQADALVCTLPAYAVNHLRWSPGLPVGQAQAYQGRPATSSVTPACTGDGGITGRYERQVGRRKAVSRSPAG